MSNPPADPNTIFRRALALHERGELTQAGTLYRNMLQYFPAHPQLLYLLGTVELQQGNHDTSAELLTQSLRLQPDHPGALANLGLALQYLGRLDEALTACERAVTLDPDFAEAHNNLGGVLRRLKRREEALAAFERAAAINPNYAEAHNNRGGVLNELGRFEDALDALARAVAVRPDYADAYVALGDTLATLSRLEDALEAYRSAIAHNPGNAETHNNLGAVLNDLGRPREALAAFDRAIAIAPLLAGAHNNRGNALLALQRPEDALAAYDRAIALEPASAEAYGNRGNILKDRMRFDEAMVSFNRAIAIAPNLAESYLGRGNLMRDILRLDEALTDYDRAIALSANYAEAYLNKSMTALMTGDFAQGWQLYEWRWIGSNLKHAVHNFKQPKWLGEESIAGKTLLIHSEQGFGDTIQFCRYAPMATALGARVIFVAPKAILPLLTTLKGDITFVEKGQPLPEFDTYCPIMSLPLAFKTTLETIPAEVPYLFADPEKRKEWRNKLGDKTKKRIGLVWSGRPGLSPDRTRSMPAKHLAPLLNMPFAFHALQKDIRPEDAETLKEFPQVQTHCNELGDFSDTAALVSEMDLVISVDTAVAHLAGALGKPVWIVPPLAGEWRWLLNRSDSPWYPSAVLFRPWERNWDTAVAAICKRLQTL